MATGPASAISPEPYGSYVLAERRSGVHITAAEQLQILQQYFDLVQAVLISAGTSVHGAIGAYGPVTHNGVDISGRWFQTSTPSKWEPTLNDTTNELLLISVAKNRVAFYASDPGLRKILLTNIGNVAAPAAIAGLSKMSSSRLIAAFLDAKQLKAMWLSGTHKSVQVKADSKVLSGSDLKYALDPLGDSSYLAAAARQENMGVSLRGSAVWTRPHKTIVSFAGDVRKIFDDLDASGTTEANLPILANELNSFVSVELPFDFDVAAPEALRLKAQQKKSVELTSQFCFWIAPSTAAAGSPAYAFDLTASPWPHTGLTGSLHLQVEPAFTAIHSDSTVEFKVVSITAPLLPWMTEIVSALEERPEIFRVFYSSGHAIAAGALSIAHPMDINFEDWKWMSFAAMPGHSTPGTPVMVYKEKPKDNDLTRIWTAARECSLFAWFVRILNDPTEAGKMGLEPLQNGTQDVWLFCDDDAGEVADFVHVFAPPVGRPKITLVHIKGATQSKDREMVAGPYEVVCGQAVKNLRYLPSVNLADRLSTRIFDVKRPLWNSMFVMGVAPNGDRDDFYSVLCDTGAEATYTVLIIQPHVTKAAFDLPKNAPMTKGALGAIQLRTLLFGVKANAAAASAAFNVVGCL